MIKRVPIQWETVTLVCDECGSGDTYGPTVWTSNDLGYLHECKNCGAVWSMDRRYPYQTFTEVSSNEGRRT